MGLLYRTMLDELQKEYDALDYKYKDPTTWVMYNLTRIHEKYKLAVCLTTKNLVEFVRNNVEENNDGSDVHNAEALIRDHFDYWDEIGF